MRTNQVLNVDAKEPLILELLKTRSLSQREIARRTGIARGTVARIAHGYRRNAQARDSTRIPDYEPLPPLRWCPTCRAKTPTPCTRCAARAFRKLLGKPL